MLEKIRNVAVIVLATLGVLFIILMLLPDDESDAVEASATEITAEAEDKETEEAGEDDGEKEEAEEQNSSEKEEALSEEEIMMISGASEEASEEEEKEEEKEDEKEDTGNTVKVNIPESELSDGVFNFRSVTLDNKAVNQSVFRDYDITMVLLWGTYCTVCISEMDDYGELYRSLPDNINIVGMLTDVYDGIDSNVDAAEDILKDKNAGFMNIRTSDSLYEVTSYFPYIPSVFYVDREGHIIGDAIAGASFSEAKNRLQKYFE